MKCKLCPTCLNLQKGLPTYIELLIVIAIIGGVLMVGTLIAINLAAHQSSK